MPLLAARSIAFVGLLALLASVSLAIAGDPTERQNALSAKVEALTRAGKYREAVPLAEELRTLTEKNPGRDDSARAKILIQLAELYQQAGSYSKALSVSENFMRARDKTAGGDEVAIAAMLCVAGEALQSLGNYESAQTALERALEIRERILGPEHADTATSLAKLAGFHAELGRFEKAKELADRSLKIREKLFGPEHAETAASLQLLSDVAQLAGHDAEEKEFSERTLKIREKILGPDHPDTAETLLGIGMALGNTGDFPKAEPLYQRALAIYEKTLGRDHPITGSALASLAYLYLNMGEFAKAEPIAKQAAKICEKGYGPNNPKTAACLTILAEVYRLRGKRADAIPICERALKIREKYLGPEHPDTAESTNNRALLYYEDGDFEHAEPLFLRTLAICQKALPPDHVFVTSTLNNLGVLYYARGEFQKSEGYYRQVLETREKSLGPDDPNVAISLDNLAVLFSDTGEFDKAEQYYQRALEIREKALGTENSDTATSIMNLATLFMQLGDYGKAQPLLERALATYEKVVGPEHELTAKALGNLAVVARRNGSYAEAESLLQRVLAINQKANGPEAADTGKVLDNLAMVYRDMGQGEKAKSLSAQGLKIREKALGPNHPNTALSLSNQSLILEDGGDYAGAEILMRRALQIDTRVLGPSHDTTGGDLARLAQLKIEQHQLKEAGEFAVQAARAQEKHLADVLSFTSERQRLAFQQTTQPYKLFGTLGRAGELAETILRQKGVVLDSLLEDRLVAQASTDPKQREIVDQLILAKQRMTQLVIESPSDPSEESRRQREKEKEKLSGKIEQLEANLARSTAGLGRGRRALSVTVDQIKAALPKQAALVELVRYSHYLGQSKDEPRYGAIVIATDLAPQWVPLGTAVEVEKNVHVYQRSVRGITDETTLSAVLHSLHEQVWAPIEKLLPAGCKTIIVSPDGELSFVSFATLLAPDDKFVSEKYSVRYVASGRDLLRDTKSAAAPLKTLRIFANADFSGGAGTETADRNAVALRSVETRDLQELLLPSLPGTEKESVELEARAKKSGWQPEVVLGPNATEAELRKTDSPRILHLATHGFFLPERQLARPADARAASVISKGRLLNPMQRSGLALTGAQRTFQSWMKGEAPPTENDGVVTAEEVGGLKLSGTWLVALSACDTGSGEAKAGEGVMGLRRGFIQSGTANLLMTLWPISDETTVRIMSDFYEAAFNSMDAPQALADTQRDWLVKLRKEKGLLAAVRLAGPFIMSSQGKP